MTYKGNANKEWKTLFEVNRQKAKGANFGLLYGMGAEGFQIYAETAYKVKMTITEATDARNKFFETYPGLLPWHEKTKALALQQGYIASPLGRIRHLPLLRSHDRQVASKELRRSVNAPVQGTLSDMSLWATAILDKAGYTKKAPICLMVHDQLCAYLPEDNWEYYAKIYKDVMENLPFHEFNWKPKVRFEVDVQVSLGDKKKGIPPNLAGLTDLKDLGVTL
jgi:DNA polymerase I-like protein with 3'-5' exonuclease and polymerase domains